MPITELGSVLSAAMAGLPVNANKILHWATAGSLCVWQQPELAHVSKWHDLVSWKLLICSHTRVRAPTPHLYKARRSGSALKKKISDLSWNDLSDAPERRQVFMWTQALHLILSKGHLSWGGYRGLLSKLQLRAGSPVTPDHVTQAFVQAALKASSHRAYTACLMISATACLPSWTTNCSLYPVWLSFHLSAAGSRPARHWWEDMAPSSPSLPCQYRQLDTASFPRLCPSVSSQFLQIFMG